MATATKKGPANGGAPSASNPESMTFVIVEDNGGDYHWTLLDHDGKSVGRSPNFARHQDAEDAARGVLAGAGSARVDSPSSDR